MERSTFRKLRSDTYEKNVLEQGIIEAGLKVRVYCDSGIPFWLPLLDGGYAYV